MKTPNRITHLLGTALVSVTLAACAKGDSAADSAGATSAGAVDTAAAVAVSPVAAMRGRWNVRAVPESPTDTVPTNYVLDAGEDSTNWSITFANRPGAVRLRVIASGGDSVVTLSDEYDSVRRKGMRVTTTAVMRVQGDRLTGTTTARFKTTGPDSVLVLRSEGTRAP